MPQSLPSLAFLGAGSMGGAIVHGVVSSGIDVDGGITVTNRSAAKADEWASTPGVTSLALERDPEANRTTAAAADVLLIGVKPAMAPGLLREIAPVLRQGTVVVSLAAGVTLETYASILGGDAVVLRAMPNTPALVRKGVTGLAAAANVTAETSAMVRRLFETVGTVIEVPEERIDALSTISGSGPAYVFLLIEELTRAAIGKGFAERDARLMAERTFIGATALLDASGDDPAELRRRVTSPNGTTERAVAVLQDAGLAAVFVDATDAALARAKELASGD